MNKWKLIGITFGHRSHLLVALGHPLELHNHMAYMVPDNSVAYYMKDTKKI